MPPDSTIQAKTRTRALGDPWPFGSAALDRVRTWAGGRAPRWLDLSLRLAAAAGTAWLVLPSLYVDSAAKEVDELILRAGGAAVAGAVFFCPARHLPTLLALCGAVPFIFFRPDAAPYLALSLLATYYAAHGNHRWRHWLVGGAVPTLLFLVVPKAIWAIDHARGDLFWWAIQTYLYCRVLYYQYDVAIGAVSPSLPHFLFYTTFWPLMRGPLFSAGDLSLLAASRGAWAFRGVWTAIVSLTKTATARWLFWACGERSSWPRSLTGFQRAVWHMLVPLGKLSPAGWLLRVPGQNFALRRGFEGLPTGKPGELWAVFVLSYVYGFLRHSARLDAVTALVRALGFQVRDSFKWVLLSPSPIELWRRWNVHLRTMLIRFFYIPAGGRQHHQHRNILFTFVMSALFVHFGIGGRTFDWATHCAWLPYFLGEGFAVCVAVAVSKWLASRKPNVPRPVRLLGRVLSWTLTLLWTSLIRTLIKARTLPVADRWHAVTCAVLWRPVK